MKRRISASVTILLTYSATAICLIAAEPKTVPAPKNASDGLTEAKTLIEKRDFDGAIRAASEAIRLNRNSAHSFYHRAVAYDAVGEYDKANADFDAAIKLSPECTYYYEARGASGIRHGDYGRGIADLRKAIRFEEHIRQGDC